MNLSLYVERGLHGLQTALDNINSIPGHQWYVLGVMLGLSPVVILIINWIKAHHFDVKAEKLAKSLVGLWLVFWSVVMTGVAFVLTNGGALAPFLGDHVFQLISFATILYNFNINKVFAGIQKTLKKWVGKKSSSPALPEQPEAPVNPFQ